MEEADVKRSGYESSPATCYTWQYPIGREEKIPMGKRYTLRCGSPRPQFRNWEIVWEMHGTVHFCTVQLSVRITEPELVRAAADVPDEAEAYIVPLLA